MQRLLRLAAAAGPAAGLEHRRADDGAARRGGVGRLSRGDEGGARRASAGDGRRAPHLPGGVPGAPGAADRRRVRARARTGRGLRLLHLGRRRAPRSSRRPRAAAASPLLRRRRRRQPRGLFASPLAQRGGRSSPPEGFGPPLSTRRGGGSSWNNVKVPSLVPKVADEEEAGRAHRRRGGRPACRSSPGGLARRRLGSPPSKKPKSPRRRRPRAAARPALEALAVAEPLDEGSSRRSSSCGGDPAGAGRGVPGEWSIAMQENDRLRTALYDPQSALEALPPRDAAAPAPAPAPDDGQMQWRELCTSIARAADEEKAMLLEELECGAPSSSARPRRRPRRGEAEAEINWPRARAAEHRAPNTSARPRSTCRWRRSSASSRRRDRRSGSRRAGARRAAPPTCGCGAR